MALDQSEANLLGNIIKNFDARVNELTQKIGQLEAAPARDRFLDEVNAGHAMLRGKGYSAADIERGEARMVKSGIANYSVAAKEGYFGAGKPVIGGVDPTHLKLLLDGNDEAFLEVAIPAALDEDSMSWWRDRLGRFAAPPSQSAEPELGPASRGAIAWLENDRARLGPLAAALREDAPTPPPSSPLSEILASVDALGARADKLVNRDRVLDELVAAGYTEEGLSELLQYAASHRITDLREAARAFDREVGYPEPVMSARGNRFMREMDADDSALRAMKGLMDGAMDEETFLETAVAGALREVRGG